MSWTSRALISSAALQHNLDITRQTVKQSKILAVIKSNGYGHGITEIANYLARADAFAVATLHEAIKVRETHPEKMIVVLQGFLTLDELNLFNEYKLNPVIHSDSQLDILQVASKTGLAADTLYWFKIDTGMGRLGFALDSCVNSLQRLEKLINNKVNIILMSHFSNADKLEDSLTEKQLNLFNRISINLNYPKSLANSAAILTKPESHFDWVRAGIMLYGVSPFAKPQKVNDLQMVMTLESKLIAINSHKKGDNIGYGSDWSCPEDMDIGVVSIGYGDGYPRHAKSGTPVLVNGFKTSIVGRVSMDMICVDLRDITDVEPGSIVTLWGENLAIEKIAECSDTIAYELLCQVGKRVEFVYQ